MSKTFYSPADILNAVYSGNSLNVTSGFGAPTDVLNAVFDSSTDSLRVNISSASTICVSGVTTDLSVTNTLNAGTILSGGTNLYDIFLTTHDGNDITRVANGTNIITGGTANIPTVNLVDVPNVLDLTIRNLTGATERVVTVIGDNLLGTYEMTDITNVYLPKSGGTVGSISVTGTCDATVITSGGTNLYSIFSTSAGSGGQVDTLTATNPNLTMGGTAVDLTIALNDSPSLNNITASGTTESAQFTSGGTNLNAVFAAIGHTHSYGISDIANLQGALDTKANLTGTTNFSGVIQSGGTDLYNIFATSATGGQVDTVTTSDPNIIIGGTAVDVTLAIADSPAFNDLSASGTTTLATVNATTYNISSSNLSAATFMSFGVALSDETTQIASATTAAVTVRMPYSMTVTEAIACLTTSGSTQSTFDVHQTGTTMFSTRITVDTNEFSSLDASAQPVITGSTLVKNALVEFFIDIPGTGAKGAKIFLNGYKI